LSDFAKIWHASARWALVIKAKNEWMICVSISAVCVVYSVCVWSVCRRM